MPTLTTAAPEPTASAPAAMRPDVQHPMEPGAEQRSPRKARAVVQPVETPEPIARNSLPLAMWGGVAGMAMGLGAGVTATLTGGLIGMAAVACLSVGAKSRGGR